MTEPKAYGEARPEQSGDDTDLGWGEIGADDPDDLERLTREKPPHYSA